MPRYEVNDQAPKYRRIVSQRFICDKCYMRVWEHVPVVRLGMGEYFRRTGTFPQVKLECPNGCKGGVLQIGYRFV